MVAICKARIVALVLALSAIASPPAQAKLAINLRFPDGSTARELT